MSTPFNLPSIRRDPLGQALDRLPQFLLTLSQMQERRGEREERARRANVQETERKTAREMEFLRMFQQTDPDVQVAGIEGLQDFLETKSGRRAGAVVAKNARERQTQKRALELEKDREDRIKGLMDLVSSGTRALAQGQIGAEDIVTSGMNELARMMGISVAQEPDTAIVDTGVGTLGLDLRAAGLIPPGGVARRGEEAPFGQLFEVTDPTTLGGLISPGRRLEIGGPFTTDSLSQLFNLINAPR